MSVTLAGVTLPDPSRCDPGEAPAGTLHRMADGTPQYSYAGAEPTRRTWAVGWDAATDAQRQLLREVWIIALNYAVTWTPPNETAVYQVKALDDYRSPRAGWLRYAVSFTLQEA